jgi:hypothetical protein
VFANYLLLFLLTIIFLEIFFILIQTVKNKFSCHVLPENAVLIAPNFAFYCGVRRKSQAAKSIARNERRFLLSE